MISARDGIFSRYAEESDDDGPADLVVIGAPPISVSTGAPGSREEAEAYVNRVDRAADRLQATYAAWAKEKWEDTPVDEQRPPTDAELSFIGEWQAWFLKWKAATVRFVSPDFVFPPAPAAIWLETEQFEQELEVFRQRFVALSKGTHVAPPPAPPAKGYEDPGGLDQPGILDGLTSSLPSLGTVAAVVVGGALILVAVNR